MKTDYEETKPVPQHLLADKLGRWNFRYTIENFGPEKLESGEKRCENDGCACPADMIVEGESAIFFACSLCAQKIPGAKVLRSNVEHERLPVGSPLDCPVGQGTENTK